MTAATASEPSAAPPVRVALVGLGWWGSKVAQSVRSSSKLEVIVGVDPLGTQRDSFGATYGVETTGALEDVLDDVSVDALVICSPHAEHARQVVAAAEHGKHVFCEKPFTRTAAEASEALAAVARSGIEVAVGHERRFEPAVLEMLSHLERGALGTPLVFEGNFSQDKFLELPPDNWRLSPRTAPVGPLSATGIHLVDLAISALGRPVEVWARLGTLATRFANGDTLSTTIAFESGATATITAVLTSPFLGRVCVMGSEGWFEILDRSHPEAPTGWDVRITRRGEGSAVRSFPPYDAVLANLEAFADAVTGRAAYPVSAEHIALNVATFEAIVRSAGTGRVETV